LEFSLGNLLLILLFAFVAGTIASRLGYPAVLGELAVGVIFGPPLLGLIHGDEGIVLLGRLGILFMMLYIGMRTDVRTISKSFGKASIISIGAFLTPFLGGFFVSVNIFNAELSHGLIIGAAIGTTALATVPRMVVDMELVKTQLGQVLLSVALFSVVVSLVAFSIIVGIIDSSGPVIVNISSVIGKVILFFLGSYLIGVYLIPRISNTMRSFNLIGRTQNCTFIILVALTYGYVAELLGLHLILGGFIAGLFIDKKLFTGSQFDNLIKVIKDIGLGFLTPIFFVSAGFSISFGVINTHLLFLVAIILVAIIGKIVGGTIFGMLGGQSWREALITGIGINGRGGVDVVMAGIGLENGYINSDVFTIIIFTSFIATLTVPILLKPSVAWLRSNDNLIELDG